MKWQKWAESGRVEDFRFVRLSSLNGSETRIDGVTECSITIDWNNDGFVSGSMSRRVRGRDFIDNEYVRVYFLPSIGGEKEEIELATFVGITTNATLDENGWWTQKVELKSPLCRYTESDIWWNAVLEAGKNGVTLFKSAMKKLGGSYKLEGIYTWYMPDTTVVEFGKSGMDLLKAIVGGTFITKEGNRGIRKIACDTHGRLTLLQRRYLNVYSKQDRNDATITAELPVKPGVTRACSWQSSASRIALAYTESRWAKEWTVTALSDESIGDYGYPGKLLWPIVKAEKLHELDYDDADGGNYMDVTVDDDTFTLDITYLENEYKAVNTVYVNGELRDDYKLVGKTSLRFDEQLHEGDFVQLRDMEIFRPPWEREENAQKAIRELAREKFLSERFENGGEPTYTLNSYYLPVKVGSYYLLIFDGQHGIRANAMCERITYRITDHIEMESSYRLAGGDVGMNYEGKQKW